MIRKIKDALYFAIARYFRFFAHIRLRRWKPRIVLITGSNGKTVCLHLCAAQFGSAAKYSFNANSAFGIPFNILGLKRADFSLLEWPALFLLAPVCAFRGPHPEKIYFVEVDGDRPGAGDFFGSFLKPEVTIVLSSARTHSMLFERTVGPGGFKGVDEAIAHGFGRFLAHTSKLAIINADNPRIVENTKQTAAEVYEIREKTSLSAYAVSISGTVFTIRDHTYQLPYMLPKEIFYALEASIKTAEYFGVKPTDELSTLVLPPGRSSVFRGIKNTTIVDSSYNANAESVAAIVRMAEQLPGEKWFILGDLTEQGKLEQEEHERLARLVAQSSAARVILVGPRMQTHALPLLKALAPQKHIESYIRPDEALTYLQKDISGGEILVFKGARFLEGIIERLLENAADAEKLCRREHVWQMRRKHFGV